MSLPPFELYKPFDILVLDDDPMWRHFVKFTLELELKVTPLLAASGQEALDILETRHIDIVISDLYMPVMSGLEFLHRARLQSPTTKIIIMSAAFEPSTPTPPALISAGAVAIISKVEIASNLAHLICNL